MLTYLRGRCGVQNEAVREMVTKAQQSPRCAGQSLQSLLIMPVQRVPRYELLLRELIKQTDDDHVDMADLRVR